MLQIFIWCYLISMIICIISYTLSGRIQINRGNGITLGEILSSLISFVPIVNTMVVCCGIVYFIGNYSNTVIIKGKKHELD